jgi:alkylated DNA nucleotide flippase Atl1
MSVTKIYRLDNQPFSQIPNEAIRDRRITPNAFRLLAYVMSHKDGYDLTYGQIERQTGIGRFAINKAIENLTAIGWVRVVRTKQANGQFGSKAWEILNPTTVDNSTVEQPHMEQPTDIKNKTKEDNKTLEKYPQAELEEAFNKFWKSYPRKAEKIDARKAFDKAVAEYSLEEVIEGAERLAKDPHLPPKQFVPYPASWLNAGGWTNEPYPERQLSKDEIETKQRAEKEARWERETHERDATRKRLAQEREEARKAYEQPREQCEHGRTKLACLRCSKT